MSDFYSTPEWKLGDAAQQRYAREKAAQGVNILPTYGMVAVDAATKAPVLFYKKGILIVPDLCLIQSGKCQFHEIKAKSQPTWRRISPGPRWEHGCDYSLAEEYKRVVSETGAPVFIIVNEVASPLDPNRDSLLIPSDVWLLISLSRILDIGDRRRDWPGGKKRPNVRGRRGMGGLLWAGNEMTDVLIGDRKRAA